MKAVDYHEGVPVDRLGRIALRMSDAMCAHPEASGHERVIIILTDPEAEDCMTHSHGYDRGADGMIDSITDVLNHLRALCAMVGMDAQLFPSRGGQG